MGKKDVEEPPPPPYQEIVQPQTILVYERSDRVTYQDAPQQVHCLNCNNDVVTTISYESGLLTWLLCGLILLLGGWCCCCLIPFFVDRCKDVHHSCSACYYDLGRYKRL